MMVSEKAATKKEMKKNERSADEACRDVALQ
jgi:hypothetical protein